MLVGQVGVGVGWGFLLAVNLLCSVNVDDSFPPSQETSLRSPRRFDPRGAAASHPSIILI